MKRITNSSNKVKRGFTGKEKTSVQLSLKVSPWKAFLFKKYAEHYGYSLKSAFSEAVNCLAQSGISKTLIKKWAKEYRGKKNEMD